MTSDIDVFQKKFEDDDRERAFQDAMNKASDQLRDEMVKAGMTPSKAGRHVRGLVKRIGDRALAQQNQVASNNARDFASGIKAAQTPAKKS